MQFGFPELYVLDNIFKKRLHWEQLVEKLSRRLITNADPELLSKHDQTKFCDFKDIQSTIDTLPDTKGYVAFDELYETMKGKLIIYKVDNSKKFRKLLKDLGYRMKKNGSGHYLIGSQLT